MLDIGAADRWIEPHLSKSVEYVSLDYLSTGRDLYCARPHVFADAAHLPFQGEYFDGVICLEVLEHLPDPVIVMKEIQRVLRPGGHAWISMPFLYPLHDAPFDFQRYTEFGLLRDIERAGLRVVSLQKSGHAIRAAGLLMCLAVAGGVHTQIGWKKFVLLPFGFIAVVSINVIAWSSSLFWPDWSSMAMGYELEVSKP